MTVFRDFFNWLTSEEAMPTLFTAAIIFISMLVSAWVAARVTRRTAGKLIEHHEFELRAAAIATLVDAATEASVWNSLSPAEQVLSDRASGQAETMLRLLPVKGSDVAADWAAHQIAQLKRASASCGYELEPAVAGFRDRLIEWQKSPSRARRGFANDRAGWAALDGTPAAQLAAEQDQWVAEQHHQKHDAASLFATEEPAAAPLVPEPTPVAAVPLVPASTAPVNYPSDAELSAALAEDAQQQPPSTSIWGGSQS